MRDGSVRSACTRGDARQNRLADWCRSAVGRADHRMHLILGNDTSSKGIDGGIDDLLPGGFSIVPSSDGNRFACGSFRVPKGTVFALKVLD
jgi:hypothetical protein